MTASKEQLAAAAALLLDRQAARRPVHVHRCPTGDHNWTCPSPYCEDVNSRPRTCPACGGDFPEDTTADDFHA